MTEEISKNKIDLQFDGHNCESSIPIQLVKDICLDAVREARKETLEEVDNFLYVYRRRNVEDIRYNFKKKFLGGEQE